MSVRDLDELRVKKSKRVKVVFVELVSKEKKVEDVEGKDTQIFFIEKYLCEEVVCMLIRRLEDKDFHRKSREIVTRKPRIDKGSTQLTPRDIEVLRWIGEMYTARLDQVKVLLERNRELAEGAELTTLTPDAARKVVERWLRRGVVGYEKILSKHQGYVWLTPRGLRELGFKEDDNNYRDWSPTAHVEHKYYVNQVRLQSEAQYKDEMEWTSERTLKASKSVRKGHDVDGELLFRNKLFAVEVELSTKRPVVLRSIMGLILHERIDRTTPKYNQVLYFVNSKTLGLVQRTKETFSDEEQKRIVISQI